MPSQRALTRTSYAILGLLSKRPWATYEMAKQIRRSISRFWPRAESNLYAEPKRLVADGYATERDEGKGRRPRTVYSITEKGQDALRTWVQAPGGETRLESEALLKVLFADQGSKADLLATIRSMGHAAETQRAEVRAILRDYADGGGAFRERQAVVELGLDLVNAHLEAIADWAHRAEASVEAWDGPSG
jgi:PadR family transcriptional regulator, regulatory protein AphA